MITSKAFSQSNLLPSLRYVRQASLTSAIDRGRRRENNGTVRAPGTRNFDRQNGVRGRREEPFGARSRREGSFGARRDKPGAGQQNTYGVRRFNSENGEDFFGNPRGKSDRGQQSAGKSRPRSENRERRGFGERKAFGDKQSFSGNREFGKQRDVGEKRSFSEETDQTENSDEGLSASRRSRPERRRDDRQQSRGPRKEEGYSLDTSKYPISVPYSAADSQFIYGASAVINALQAKRRKLYKLYIAKRDPDWLDAFSKPSKKQQMLRAYTSEMQTVSSLAKSAGMEIERLEGPDRHRLLDKMSSGRPHNGYTLEASPVPFYTASALSVVESAASEVVGLQKGGSTSAYMTLPASQPGERYPVVLYLDGVSDPGNLGNMIRSAYFLGVDAMILNDTCSSISPVVLKAAAGAAERMPLIKLEKGAKFLDNTRENGWKVFAAVPPPDEAFERDTASSSQSLSLADLRSKGLLRDYPAILLIGSEGEGLQNSLKSKADFAVGINGFARAREIHGGDLREIDSLNVTVAASLIMEALLSLPEAVSQEDASVWEELSEGVSG